MLPAGVPLPPLTDNAMDSENDPVYICCGKPFGGKFMIFCEKCEQWFHGECIGVSCFIYCGSYVADFRLNNRLPITLTNTIAKTVWGRMEVWILFLQRNIYREWRKRRRKKMIVGFLLVFQHLFIYYTYAMLQHRETIFSVVAKRCGKCITCLKIGQNESTCLNVRFSLKT